MQRGDTVLDSTPGQPQLTRHCDRQQDILNVVPAKQVRTACDPLTLIHHDIKRQAVSTHHDVLGMQVR